MGCKIPQVYDQIIYWGDRGGGWGGGANSERCLKRGVGGVIKKSFLKQLERRGG